ncbi:hypothetical protein FGRMN_993 [Fusarium graminum]|nr:hypothetical protein FGRMN_993 [Fusarium graminum]
MIPTSFKDPEENMPRQLPEGRRRLIMVCRSPKVAAVTVQGMARLRRDVGPEYIRSVEIGDKVEITVVKEMDDDVGIEYRYDDLWNDMERFEEDGWERVQYSLTRI